MIHLKGKRELYGLGHHLSTDARIDLARLVVRKFESKAEAVRNLGVGRMTVHRWTSGNMGPNDSHTKLLIALVDTKELMAIIEDDLEKYREEYEAAFNRFQENEPKAYHGHDTVRNEGPNPTQSPKPSFSKPQTQDQNATPQCKNPWRECKNTDIALSIHYRGEFLPVCSRCWKEISENPRREW